MEKFRIGNDLSIFWAILDDDGQPYPLSGKKVRLFVTHPRGRMEVTDQISVEDDHVVVWNFDGNRQRYLGTYKLTVEIYSSPGTRVLRRDIEEAFALVSVSLYEDVEAGKPDINESGMLTLSSILEVVRVAPIVPEIGDNGNWFVDGKDTGLPARGQAGSAVELAYVSMTVDENMELGFDYVGASGSDRIEFELNEEGELVATTEKTIAGVVGAEVTVDDTTGTPAAEATIEDAVIKLHFSGLKGEKGDTGATGATGPQGAQGPQGEKGEKGESYDDTEIRNELNALMQEVEDVESQFNNFQPGYIILNNGELAAASNGAVTEKIEVNGGDTCVWNYKALVTSDESSYKGAFVEFDANMNKVDYWFMDASGAKTIRLNASTRYIVASMSLADISGCSVAINGIVVWSPMTTKRIADAVRLVSEHDIEITDLNTSLSEIKSEIGSVISYSADAVEGTTLLLQPISVTEHPLSVGDKILVRVDGNSISKFYLQDENGNRLIGTALLPNIDNIVTIEVAPQSNYGIAVGSSLVISSGKITMNLVLDYSGTLLSKLVEIEHQIEEVRNKVHYNSFCIIGDSYSTFEGYLKPSENNAWYPMEGNDVQSVEQTWWWKFAQRYGCHLIQNNSFSGSTIAYNGYSEGSDDAKAFSFCKRVENLDNADMYIVFGGTNDAWVALDTGDDTLGDFKYSDITEEDKEYMRPALAYVLNYLQHRHVGAKILFVISPVVNETYKSSMRTICEHFNVQYVEVPKITTMKSHPDINGMEIICKAILDTLTHW